MPFGHFVLTFMIAASHYPFTQLGYLSWKLNVLRVTLSASILHFTAPHISLLKY